MLGAGGAVCWACRARRQWIAGGKGAERIVPCTTRDYMSYVR